MTEDSHQIPDEIRQIVITEWREGKENFATLGRNVETIRKWVVNNGKRRKIHEKFKSVYVDSQGTRIEAVDFDRYPDSLDALRGEVLRLHRDTDEFSVFFRFVKENLEEKWVEVLDEIPDKVDPIINPLLVETQVSFHNGERDVDSVEFPLRPAFSLSGSELAVISFFLRDFINTTIVPDPKGV